MAERGGDERIPVPQQPQDDVALRRKLNGELIHRQRRIDALQMKRFIEQIGRKAVFAVEFWKEPRVIAQAQTRGVRARPLLHVHLDQFDQGRLAHDFRSLGEVIRDLGRFAAARLPSGQEALQTARDLVPDPFRFAAADRRGVSMIHGRRDNLRDEARPGWLRD